MQPRAREVQHPVSLSQIPLSHPMICGHVEIRMLNPKTIGRMYDDELIINQTCPKCGHVTAIHIVHSGGVPECGIRHCLCRIHL